MALRFGPGPLFALESMQAARRWQTYALRSLFLAALLISLVVVWLTRINSTGALTVSQLARVGEAFFYALVGTQLGLVMLVAPAATAGAICLDKARGNLTHLLTTDLSSAEVILGKLCARLLPVLGMILATVPVLSLAALLGGVDPEALLGAGAISAAVAILGCALAMALSVWGKKTHEVLIVVYIFWSLLLLADPLLSLFSTIPPVVAIRDVFRKINPFYVAFHPYLSPGILTWMHYLPFVFGSLLLSAVLSGLAVYGLRAVNQRQHGTPHRAKASLLVVPGRTPFVGLLEWNPILWREWHRRRPSRWMKAIWIVYLLGMLLGCGLVAASALGNTFPPGRELAAFVNAFGVSIGLLLLSITSVTSLQEERMRGSLDVVMTTPLPTPSIVWGKWLGAFRSVPMVLCLPTLLALACLLPLTTSNNLSERFLCVLVLVGLMVAYAAAVVSLGLALATWISRFGRAIAINVALYVLVTAGTVFIILAMPGMGPTMRGVAAISPWYGPGWLTATLDGRGGGNIEEALGWGVVWTFCYTVVAGVLLGITHFSFDRCLGRITEGIAAKVTAQAIARRRIATARPNATAEE